MIAHTRPLAHTMKAASLSRPEGHRGGSGSESIAFRESARSFVMTSLWMTAFLGGGYLLLWKPILDRWVF